MVVLLVMKGIGQEILRETTTARSSILQVAAQILCNNNPLNILQWIEYTIESAGELSHALNVKYQSRAHPVPDRGSLNSRPLASLQFAVTRPLSHAAA